MPKIYLLITIIFCCYSSHANDEYWQQNVDYNISVSLDAVNHTLQGNVQMLYQNNANHHLDTIWIHLWPNAYSKHSTALAKQLLENGSNIMDVLPRENLGAIGKLDLKVDGKTVGLIKSEKDPDVGYFLLNEPLLPGEKITIHTPFKVKVPASISRMGTEDGYFAITQWYPKPAVYDKNGWNPMTYLDQGEFYSEFGNYHVEITVPSNYIIAATGALTDKKENNETTTYTYDQDQIHDFAWFTSPDFKVITDKVTLENGNEVAIHTYYLTEEKRWKDCHIFTKKSIQFFSDLIGPYPYNHCTVVEGPLEAGGGMEYPMITILDDDPDITRFESVVAHEVAHNWWQGILASNERRDPWIDEGFTSYYEKRYNNEIAINQFKPEEILTTRKVANFFDVQHLTYDIGEEILIRQQERVNKQQAVHLHSEKFTYFNYFLALYVKAPHQLQYLENYLGTANFDDCIRSFYQKNKFQHIDADNIQNHFESCSNKDLDFFFKDWLTTEGVVNSKISKVYDHDDKLRVEFINKGEIIVPLPLTIVREDGEETIWVDAVKEGFVDIEKEGVKKIILDKENISMDYNPSNNYWKEKGPHKLEKIRFQLFAGLENPEKTQVFFSPMIAGNAHDKFMLGLSIYNRFYPAKNFEWNITPLYAFGSKQLNGIANASYTQNIRKNKKAQIEYGVHFKTFTYDDDDARGRYLSVVPTVKATFLPKDHRKQIQHSLQWQHKHNWRQLNLDSRDGIDSITVYNPLWAEAIAYRFQKKNIKMPVNAKAELLFNNEFVKSNLETDFKIRYGKIDSYFSARFFFSIMSNNFISGLEGSNGRRDYFFDNYYLGRSQTKGFLSRQIALDEGQFKLSSRIPTLPTNFILTSLNLRVDFPSKWIPIKAYLDLGVVSSDFSSTSFVYQAGIMLSLLNEAFEVYFPLTSSGEIKNLYNPIGLDTKYKERISFSLNLDKLNPHKFVKNYEF